MRSYKNIFCVTGTLNIRQFAQGFSHGLSWCVKYMVVRPLVVDRGPEGQVFHISRQTMIKSYNEAKYGNMV